jgi:hypothetical protein
VPPHAKAAPSRGVNTQVNTNVVAMTDAELPDYRQLLRALKAPLPEEAPKVIEGSSREDVGATAWAPTPTASCWL